MPIKLQNFLNDKKNLHNQKTVYTFVEQNTILVKKYGNGKRRNYCSGHHKRS